MWRRLPTYFPNLRLVMLPLTQEQQGALDKTGWLREVAFKCEPRTTKLEIKAYLEAVHRLEVERVNTINYQGRKVRQVDNFGRPHFYRKSDWKKAYVTFKPPEGSQAEDEQEQRAVQQQKRLEELKKAALARSRLPDFLPAAAAAVSRDVAKTVLQNAQVAVQKAEERRAREKAIAVKQWAEKRAAALAEGSSSSSSSGKAGGSSSSSKNSSRNKGPARKR